MRSFLAKLYPLVLLPWSPPPALSFNVNVIPTSDKPDVEAVNNTHLLVEYRNAFTIYDFARVRKVLLLGYLGKRTEKLAEAVKYPKGEKDNSSEQSLVEGQRLIVETDICQEFTYPQSLILRVFSHGSSNAADNVFEYSPTALIEKYSNYWICAENRSSVRLTKDNFDIFPILTCLQNIQFESFGMGYKQNPELKFEQSNILKVPVLNHIDLKINHNEQIVELISCRNQSRINVLLRNSDPWICRTEANTTLALKTQWEDFSLTFRLNEDITEDLVANLDVTIMEPSGHYLKTSMKVPLTVCPILNSREPKYFNGEDHGNDDSDRRDHNHDNYESPQKKSQKHSDQIKEKQKDFVLVVGAPVFLISALAILIIIGICVHRRTTNR